MPNHERFYKALGNRRRLLILAFLCDRPRATVGEVADAIRLSIHATSKHLGKLKAVDILESEQISKRVYYRLADHRCAVLSILLAELRQPVTSPAPHSGK